MSVLSVLLALLVAAGPVVPGPADDLVEQACRAASTGDRQTAWRLIDQALGLAPLHVEANFARGWLLQEAGELQAAISQYRKVLALAAPQDPYAVQAREALGRLVGKCKTVALAFDDFPFAHDSPKLLSTLRTLRVPATFFAIGFKVRHFPDLAAQAVAEGYSCQNHTYSHGRLTGLADQVIMDEIQRGADAIEAATGIRPHLLRLPGGHDNAHIRELARRCRHVVVDNVIAVGDYAITDPAVVEQRVLRSVRPGCIIALHDGVESTRRALPGIVRRLREQGYCFVTVDEVRELAGDAASPCQP